MQLFSKPKIELKDAISWLLKFILFGIFVTEAWAGDWLLAVGALAAVMVSLLPAIVFRNYKMHLPWGIDFAVTGMLLIHFIGLLYNWYHTPELWWWDLFTHFLGTAVIATIAFYITFTLDFTGKLKLTLPFIVISTITTAMAIGALWEVAEYYFDIAFGTLSQPGIEDAVQDLLFDLFGAIVVAGLGTWYAHRYRLKHKRHGLT